MNIRWWVIGLSMATLAVACGDDESQDSSADRDRDGWPVPLDCDDNDDGVFPGADEVPYDGIDQDCSGSDLTDLDGDGFDGGADEGTDNEGGAAGAGSGESGGAEDCDDRRPDVNPTAVDICGDGIDQDCSGGDQACDELDRDGDGTSGKEGDCNDRDPAIGPHAEEIYYNGVDDDCDPYTVDGDQDGDGFSRVSGGDCDDEDAAVFLGAEEIPYDGIDQDCSGGDLVDVDGDGVPGGPEGSDCDDLDPTVRPGRNEVVADGIDQNCDGSDLAGVDEFVRLTGRSATPASKAAIAAGVDGDGEPIALAAWPDSRNSTSQDVYAQRLSHTGKRVGSEIVVVEAGLSKSDVRVAAHDSVFLVTWRTSDGVFAQLVSGEGERIANDQPIGAAGGAGVDVSYGPDNFAVVWRQTDVNPVEVRVRGVTVEGVRSDNNVVFAGGSSAVAIASTPEEHMVFWTGDAGYGLFAHRVNGRGEPIGDVLEVSDLGPFGSLAAARAGSRYALVLQQSGPTQSARGFIVDVAGDVVVGGDTGVRLSQESFSIPNVAIASASGGFFAGWQDLRHITAAPPLQAIYYNGFDEEGVPWFAHDRALHADVGVELGGAARVGEHVLVLSRNSFGLGVVPVPLLR